MVRGSCRNQKECPIDGCLSKHNKLLHDGQINYGGNNSGSSESKASSGNASVLSCVSRVADKKVLLLVHIVLCGLSKKIEIYALLDEDSSVTMVDSSLVRQLSIWGVTK